MKELPSFEFTLECTPASPHKFRANCLASPQPSRAPTKKGKNVSKTRATGWNGLASYRSAQSTNWWTNPPYVWPRSDLTYRMETWWIWQPILRGAKCKVQYPITCGFNWYRISTPKCNASIRFALKIRSLAAAHVECVNPIQQNEQNWNT